MVEICSNYLAQIAEFSSKYCLCPFGSLFFLTYFYAMNIQFITEDKGPAFKILLKAMQEKNNEQLYQKGKAKRTYAKAATE